MSKKYFGNVKRILCFFVFVLFISGCGTTQNSEQGGVRPVELSSDKIIYFYFYYPSGNMPDHDFEITSTEEGFLLTSNDYHYELQDKKILLDEEDMRKLHNIVVTYNVAAWNGFDESVPENERSSANETFILYIRYDNQTEISARGVQRFPEHYKEVEEEILDCMKGFMEE